MVAQRAAGGFAVIFWCAYLQRECLLKARLIQNRQWLGFGSSSLFERLGRSHHRWGQFANLITAAYFYIADRFEQAAAGAGAILFYLNGIWSGQFN